MRRSDIRDFSKETIIQFVTLPVFSRVSEVLPTSWLGLSVIIQYIDSTLQYFGSELDKMEREKLFRLKIQVKEKEGESAQRRAAGEGHRHPPISQHGKRPSDHPNGQASPPKVTMENGSFLL